MASTPYQWDEMLIPDRTPGDAYKQGRQLDIDTIEEDTWAELNAAEAVQEAPEEGVPVVEAPLPDPDRLSEEARIQDGEKTFFQQGIDALTFATSPLMALGDAAIAPLAHEFESDTFLGQTGEALKVSGQAALARLLPEFGKEDPGYAKKVVENIMPDASSATKGLVSGTLDIITDPTISLSLPFYKVIQSGMKTAQASRAVEGAEDFKGIFQEGITELLTLGKGIDPDDLTAIGELAVKADAGDKVAIGELDNLINQSEDMKSAIQLLDDADVVTKVKDYDAIIGNPNAPTFKQSFAEDAPELLKKSLDSNEQARALNINTAKINSSEDVDNLLTRVSEIYAQDFNKAAGKDSGSSLVKEAQNNKLTDLLGKKTAEFSAPEAYGLRQVLLSSANQLSVLAQRASLPGASRLDDIAFEKAFTIHRAIQEKATGVAAEAGRLLQSFNIVAKEGRGRLREVNALITNLPKDSATRRLLKAFLEAADATEANKIVSKTNLEKGTDALTEVYVNSILSGPITHAVNLSSNTMNMIISPTESYLSGLSAAARLDYSASAHLIGEGNAKLSGVVNGLADGMRLLYRRGDFETVGIPQELGQMHEIAKQSIRPAISSEALGVTGKLGTAVDYMGAFIRLPGQALLAEDKLAKVMHYRIEEAAQAFKASQRGTTAADKRAIYNAMRSNPTEGMVSKSIDMASYYTFTNELGTVGSAAHKFLQSNPATRILVPFFKTPTNIVKMGLKYGPFGDIYRGYQKIITLGNAEGDLARAQFAMGTVAPMVIASMLSDNITGRIDKATPSGRFKASQDIPEYSMRIGDTWYSYGKIEPLRSVLGLMTNYRDAKNADQKIDPKTGLETEISKRLTSAIIAPFVGTVTDNYMLQSFSSIVQMLDGLNSGNPEGSLKVFKRIAAASTVPYSAFLRQSTQQIFDDNFRKADSYIDMMKQGIPTMSSSLPARYTIWGDEQLYPDGLGPDAISPIRTMSVKEDAIDKEIVRLGVNIPGEIKDVSPGRVGVKVELTPQQAATANQLRGKGFGGQTLKQSISLMMTDPGFKILSDTVKKEQIESVMNRATDSAKKITFSKDPDIQATYRANLEAYTRQRQGATQ